MKLIDTNVLSELMKPDPQCEVLAWFDQQESDTLFVSAITIAEISYGLHALPEGQRRTHLEHAFKRAIQLAFGSRILNFCLGSAKVYGKIMALRKREGMPLSILDGQIAAIAHDHGYTLVTRNTRDFVHCGLQLVNPFLKS